MIARTTCTMHRCVAHRRSGAMPAARAVRQRLGACVGALARGRAAHATKHCPAASRLESACARGHPTSPRRSRCARSPPLQAQLEANHATPAAHQRDSGAAAPIAAGSAAAAAATAPATFNLPAALQSRSVEIAARESAGAAAIRKGEAKPAAPVVTPKPAKPAVTARSSAVPLARAQPRAAAQQVGTSGAAASGGGGWSMLGWVRDRMAWAGQRMRSLYSSIFRI